MRRTNDALSSHTISLFSSSLPYAFFRSHVLWASGDSKMDTGEHSCGLFIASSVTWRNKNRNMLCFLLKENCPYSQYVPSYLLSDIFLWRWLRTIIVNIAEGCSKKPVRWDTYKCKRQLSISSWLIVAWETDFAFYFMQTHATDLWAKETVASFAERCRWQIL